MRKQRGLTLIELLAVIAIIAILFVLLIPQVTKATDKARVSGVQVDLHSYEVGMRTYFMEHFGEEKSAEKLNTYLDKSLQFEEVDNKWVSKVEENPYKVKYELTSDNLTYMQVSSYTDEKDPRIHAVRVYEEGKEVKSIYIGFDEDKRASEVDTTPPVIVISPNGGEDVEQIFVDVTDDVEVFNIQYAWTKESTKPTSGWQSIENSAELTTAFLGKGTYYLHIKASDIEMNTTIESSQAYKLGDEELPIIKLSINGSEEEKVKHTTVVTATDNKGIAELNYVWTDSSTPPTTGWNPITSGSTVSTPDRTGGLYLHIQAIDISGNIANYTSDVFNTGDTQPPIVSLSLNGSVENKLEHTTVLTVTDNDQLQSVRYVWSKTKTKPTEGWNKTANGTILKTPTINGILYLHIEAKDRNGNKTDFVSNGFDTGDYIFPVVELSVNGKETTATSHMTRVTVTDNLAVASVDYLWTESPTFPTGGWTRGTNTFSTTSNTRLESDVYLHVLAIDTFGNETKFTSKPFNQAPFNIKVNNNGTVDILSYKGNKTEMIVPSTIAGKPVVAIGNDSNNITMTGVTSVVLPDTLMEIKSYTFVGKNLTSITLPKNLKRIGTSAFNNNDLTEIIIPESVTTIEATAFVNNDIKSVIIPKNVTTLGNGAFKTNPNLKTVINKSSISNTNVLKAFTSSPSISN